MLNNFENTEKTVTYNLKTDFRSFLSLFTFLVTFFISSMAYAVVEDVTELTVNATVKNAYSGNPIANLKVWAYERRADNSIVYRGGKYTDLNGNVEFILQKVVGSSFFLRSRPYHGRYAYSDDFAASGSIEFKVGTLELRALSNLNGQPMAGHYVQLRRVLSDGSNKYVTSASTDENGIVRLSPDFSEGSVFIRSRNSANNSWRDSRVFSGPTQADIQIGNDPAFVTLKDAFDGSLFPGVRIYAYEKHNDNSLHYAGSATTNLQSIATFDLHDNNLPYVFKTRVYKTGSSYSLPSDASGSIDLVAGGLRLQLKSNVSPNNPIPATKAYLYKLLSDGSYKWSGYGYTDTNGEIRFSPPGLGGDESPKYVVRSKSLVNGHWHESEPFSAFSNSEFQVGNDPILVTVRDVNDNVTQNNQKVYAYRLLEDGSYKYVGRAVTNESGLAIFDLPLSGTDYVFKTRYQTMYAYSDVVSAAGAVELAVGTLQVRLLSNIDGSVLPSQKTYLYERLANGETKYISRGYTDDEGRVRFSPRDLGSTKQPKYFLKSKSQLNRHWRYSDDYSIVGKHDFTVGFAPIAVKVQNAYDNSLFKDTEVWILERLENGKVSYRQRANTDSEGVALFDIEGVGERDYYFRARAYDMYAYSDPVTLAGDFTFNVGTLEIKLVSNIDQSALGETRLYLYEIVDGEDNPRYRYRANTDSDGFARFTPQGIDSADRKYLIRYQSAINNSWRNSTAYTSSGQYVLQAGSDPLVVSVKDYISKSAIDDLRIYVYEHTSDGKTTYRGRGNTDSDGKLLFDIPTLGEGNSFVLKSNPYNSGWVYSDLFDETGEFNFDVGTLQLTLLSNIDPETSLADKRVYLYEVLSDDETAYIGRANSDDNGVVRFTPNGLGNTRNYVAKSQSPVNGKWRYSDKYISKGAFNFQVGFDPIIVNLTNGVTGSSLADAKLYAVRIGTNGEKHWEDRVYTDQEGKAVFDLAGISNGFSYRFYARPYNAGGVYSQLVSNSGVFNYRVGTSPVTLIDGDTNSVLIGHYITAYRKLPSGDLQWVRNGVSDATGTVHFDLDFSDGNPYVFYSRNLFGEGKRYYSALVSNEGAVSFIVTVDGDNTLDLTPPEVNISNPLDNENVSENGFTVSGLATDDRNLESVVLSVGVGGNTSTIVAALEPLTSSWTAQVPGNLVSVNDVVLLTATATDRAQNETTATVTVNVVTDTTGPVITVTSHSENDDVASTGFLLSGTSDDLTGVASMSATLQVAGIADTVKDVTVAANGTWTVRINNGEVIENQVVLIDLSALDSEGNQGVANITLNVVPVDYAGLQLLNRMTFGATPELFTQLDTLGEQGFITQQLNPESINDDALASLLGADPTSREELQRWTLLRMIYSQRQLLEVMTYFWDNHFSTSIDTTRTDWQGNSVSNNAAYELAENQAFRANALGSFRTLLGISARSPSMLIYLDSISNVAGDSNENYSREIQELSTLGVGNFTEQDVEAGAVMLTGWHLDLATDSFVFNADQHTDVMDDGSMPVFLGNVITETGEAQGDRMLDILASHPSTANYICTKLVQYFINDIPPSSAVDSCAATFSVADGMDDQMTQVMSTILSNEFFDPANYRAKIKTPIEFIAGALRNFQGNTNASDLISASQSMGLRLFQNPVPTGYSEIGADWINSSLLIERIEWVNDMSRNSPSGSSSSIDPISYLQSEGYFTNEAIVDYLLQLTIGDDVTDLVRQQMLSVFGAYQMDLSAPLEGDDELLRQLIGTVLSIPQYQFQ